MTSGLWFGLAKKEKRNGNYMLLKQKNETFFLVVPQSGSASAACFSEGCQVAEAEIAPNHNHISVLTETEMPHVTE